MGTRREPPWWVRDVVLAIVIGGLFIGSQWIIDDRRSDREAEAAAHIAEQAERLENLRFVRERSGPEPVLRPFAEIDLFKQTLDGLELGGADFRGAQLSFATFRETDLSGADFTDANLFLAEFDDASLVGADLHCAGSCVPWLRVRFPGTDLTNADLSGTGMRGAYFDSRSRLEGTDLSSADLSGALLIDVDFSGANLNGTSFDDACWTRDTRWPPGLEPSHPSRDIAACRV